jgi:hypothetical protein
MTSCRLSKVALVLATAYSCFNPSPASPQVHGVFKPNPAIQDEILQGYGKLPLSFEANQGQADARVKFLSRGAGYTLFLTSEEAVLSLRKGTEKSEAEIRPLSVLNVRKPTARDEQRTANAVLRMQIVGANPNARASGGMNCRERATTSSATIRESGAPRSLTTRKFVIRACIRGLTSFITVTRGSLSMTLWLRRVPTPTKFVSSFPEREGSESMIMAH